MWLGSSRPDYMLHPPFGRPNARRALESSLSPVVLRESNFSKIRRPFVWMFSIGSRVTSDAPESPPECIATSSPSMDSPKINQSQHFHPRLREHDARKKDHHFQGCINLETEMGHVHEDELNVRRSPTTFT